MHRLNRRPTLARAVTLEWLTIAWTALAGTVGMAAGLVAHSVSTTAFGLDAYVEMICAGVLLRRLMAQRNHHPDVVVRLEMEAGKIVGALLVAAAVYVVIYAGWNLSHHRGQAVSVIAMALTLATLPVMVPLAGAKLKLAGTLRSRALRADAIGNAVCWYLAAIVLVGLAAQVMFKVWWLDGAASLAVVALLIKEGLDAWRGVEVGG